MLDTDGDAIARDYSARWLVASALVLRLGAPYRVDEWYRNDTRNHHHLLVHAPDRPSIVLHHHGSLSVHDGPNWQQVAGGELEPPSRTVWAGVASGAQSVVALVERVLNVLTQLGVTPAPGPYPQLAAIRFMAEALRIGTLFRTGWRVEQGRQWWHDGDVPIEHEDGSRDGVAEVITGLIDELPQAAQPASDADAADLWFITGPSADNLDQRRVIAALTPQLEFLRPDSSSAELQVIDLCDRPWQTVPRLLSGALSATIAANAAAGQPARTPGLGVPAAIEAFNRKERSLLFAAVTGARSDLEAHGPSLPIAPWLIDTLNLVLGDSPDLQIPPHAWMGIDYHLSWLHGALSWAAGLTWPHQTAGFLPNKADSATAESAPVELVSGNQEDADLLLAWTTEVGAVRVVIVEAKGYTSWDNRQVASKVKRLTALHAAAKRTMVDFQLRWVLASPRPPHKLNLEGLPPFARSVDRQLYWIELPASGMRLTTQRCNDSGRHDQNGELWRITGPANR